MDVIAIIDLNNKQEDNVERYMGWIQQKREQENSIKEDLKNMDYFKNDKNKNEDSEDNNQYINEICNQRQDQFSKKGS